MYALIQNGNIEVGPRDWYLPMFYNYLVEELDLLDEAKTLPRTAPNTILTGTGWSILPTRLDTPPATDAFEQLVGPTWVVNQTEVVGSYTKTDVAVSQAQNTLMSAITATRYAAENAGITLLIEDVQVRIPTDRETRSIFSVGVPGKWKFKQVETVTQVRNNIDGPRDVAVGDIWLSVSSDTISMIKTAVQTYVQSCFDWEARVAGQINAASTIADLRLVDVTLAL